MTATATTPQPQPFDWIKQLPTAILQADEIPLFGKAPPFPWDKLSNELSRVFQIENVVIQPSEMQWRTPDQLSAGMGSEPIYLHCAFSPLEGSLTWVMNKSDIAAIMQILLTRPPENFQALDPDFQQGFYRFLAAQVINIVNKLDFDKNLSPSLHQDTTPHEKPAFCIDVSIALPQKTFMGRVILSSALRHSWMERYADRKLGLNYNSPLAQKLQVIVHLEAGKTELTQSEWSEIVPGDFLMLDFCSFEPDSDKGRIMMTVDGVPMFRARLKQGDIKILEFPLYHEVETPMNKDESEDEDEDEFEESELEETEDEEEFEDELTEEETETEMETEEEPTEAEEPKVQSKKEQPPEKVATPSLEKKGAIKPEELPLTVIIEVGRVQMSIQKLMELQPGNVLELDIHPENGVDLVINGRRVGKGELLKVGETLGVRILDIG